MFEIFKFLTKRTRRAILAILVAIFGTTPGCDKKPEWKGISTDNKDDERGRNADSSPGEVPHDQRL
jgi:hypothetical protein